ELLTATDREGLEKQADLILETTKPETPDFDGGVRDTPPEPVAPEKAHNDVFLEMLGLKTN
ncbi:MAG: hypothetical protein KDB62_10505, partial [Solirubrobacterales bacterium]|nr:hypothetical protein [Solirubrobacterales bacterium]